MLKYISFKHSFRFINPVLFPFRRFAEENLNWKHKIAIQICVCYICLALHFTIHM